MKLLKRAKLPGVIHRCGQVKQDKLVTWRSRTSSVIHKPSLYLDSHGSLDCSLFNLAFAWLTLPKVGSLGRYHALKHLTLFHRCKVLFYYLISLCCQLWDGPTRGRHVSNCQETVDPTVTKLLDRPGEKKPRSPKGFIFSFGACRL